MPLKGTSVMPRARFARWPSLAAAVLVLVASCGSADAGANSSGGRSIDGELVVFAAASLTESFREIEAAFERMHPGVDVRMSFEGSSSLAQKVIRGAPAGVFASANPRQMRLAAKAGQLAAEPVTFAANRLQIAVPPGNPANVRSLAAFGKERLKLALCAKEVPCGAAAREALRIAGVAPRPDTLEQDVKAVLTKVRLGEVDAGLVYRTDVAAADGAVHGIGFPAAAKAVNEYQIGVLRQAPNGDAAGAFVDFVLSKKGQKILAEFGFDTTT